MRALSRFNEIKVTYRNDEIINSTENRWQVSKYKLVNVFWLLVSWESENEYKIECRSECESACES